MFVYKLFYKLTDITFFLCAEVPSDCIRGGGPPGGMSDSN